MGRVSRVSSVCRVIFLCYINIYLSRKWEEKNMIDEIYQRNIIYYICVFICVISKTYDVSRDNMCWPAVFMGGQ